MIAVLEKDDRQFLNTYAYMYITVKYWSAFSIRKSKIVSLLVEGESELAEIYIVQYLP